MTEYDNLRKGYVLGEVEARIVALHDGYVTAISEKGLIHQCWAGEFTHTPQKL